MKKIPFNISYKDDIISGKVKVVTKDNKPVKIVCFDAYGSNPIIASVIYKNGTSKWEDYSLSGHWLGNVKPSKMDLFLLVPSDPLKIIKGHWYLCIKNNDIRNIKMGSFVQAEDDNVISGIMVSPDSVAEYFVPASGNGLTTFESRLAEILFYTSRNKSDASDAEIMADAIRLAAELKETIENLKSEQPNCTQPDANDNDFTYVLSHLNAKQQHAILHEIEKTAKNAEKRMQMKCINELPHWEIMFESDFNGTEVNDEYLLRNGLKLKLSELKKLPVKY